MSQRLAAILVADICGFTARIERDEAATLALLYRMRDDLLLPEVARFGGVTRRRAGDGVLALFPAAIDAVNCALAIQEANRDPARYGGMQLRIGVNLGDVVVEDDSVHGHDINLAVRIEALAEPGGIVMTASVRDAVRAQGLQGLVPLGRRRLKNISERLDLYALYPGRSGSRLIELVALARRHMAALLLLAGVTAGAAMVAGRGGPALGGLAGPGMASYQPSVAVLPFRASGRLVENDPLQIGLTHEIIDNLSAFSQLRIMAAYSAIQFAEVGRDVTELHRDYGVSYVLTGALMRGEDSVTIFANLAHLPSGDLIWSDRFAGANKDIFAIQRQITERIAAAIGPIAGGDGVLTSREIQRLAGKAPESFGAFDYLLQGREREKSGDLAGARAFYQRALAQDPRYVKAQAGLANIHIAAYLGGGAAAELAAARQAATAALGLDDQEARAHDVLGRALILSGEHDAGLAALRHAHGLNPNGADMMYGLGWGLALGGAPQEALDILARATALNPYPPGQYREARALAQFAANTPRAAIATLRPVQPRSAEAELLLAASYGQLGELQNALATARVFRRMRPDMGLQMAVARHPFRDPADQVRFRAGLLTAGIVDHGAPSPSEIGR